MSKGAAKRVCTVRVSSSQLVCGQKETAAFESEGIWDADAAELEFDDAIKNDNNEPFRTKLVMFPGRIMVYRDGALQFDFDCAGPKKTIYRTPAGEIPMEISTDRADVLAGESGGHIGIGYTLVFEPDTKIVCTYEIEIVAKDIIIC